MPVFNNGRYGDIRGREHKQSFTQRSLVDCPRRIRFHSKYLTYGLGSFTSSVLPSHHYTRESSYQWFINGRDVHSNGQHHGRNQDFGTTLTAPQSSLIPRQAHR